MKRFLFMLSAVVLIFAVLFSINTFYQNTRDADFCRLGFFKKIVPLPKPAEGCEQIALEGKAVEECDAVQGHFRPRYDDRRCISSYYCETCEKMIKTQPAKKDYAVVLATLALVLVLIVASFKFKRFRVYIFSLIAILLVLGLLVHYGLLEPIKLLPNKCAFGSEITCEDYIVKYGNGTDGSVAVRLKNNIGAVIIIGWNISSDLEAISCEEYPPSDAVVIKDEINDYTFKGCDIAAAGIEQGKKHRIEIFLHYYEPKSGPAFPRMVEGDIIAKAR
jgi:hypothetical protein